MKTALITTTINVPTVLQLYRQHDPDVAFFVAIDRKTSEEAVNFCACDIPDCRVIYTGNAEKYKCAPLIGLDSIQRRNLALLEAVKWGADIIVSVDDDNIPLGPSYFSWFHAYLDYPFSGIKVSGRTGWFDPGRLFDPVSKHRGFPITHRNDPFRVDHVVNAKIGVAAGICLGDPDIDAVTRIERSPEVHRVSELLNAGIVVDPATHAVFNSQNTAFICELAPAFFMLPGVGRYDDIYASLIMQRVMRERNLHVHFGKPFVWQQRNQHDLIKDLRGEIDGMTFVESFAYLIDIDLPDGSVLEQVRFIWLELRREGILPPETAAAALAFLEDMEGVL